MFLNKKKKITYLKVLSRKKIKLKRSSSKLKKSRFSLIKKKSFLKLKKKWRFWRIFKRFFLFTKKITFFKKLQWSFNNARILKHQLLKMYLPTNKKKYLFTYKNKIGTKWFSFFLRKLELRLSILLLRARFCYKLINCYSAIKYNLILVNGIIFNKINYVLSCLDLIQKRRSINLFFRLVVSRPARLKWRKKRWRQARYMFWKIRRVSHFNLFWNRKQNTTVNYLEINYKIPACIIIKQPFLKELLLNKQVKMLTLSILKKIYFLY